MNKKEKITKTLENFSGGRELLEKFHKKDLILWNWKWYRSNVVVQVIFEFSPNNKNRSLGLLLTTNKKWEDLGVLSKYTGPAFFAAGVGEYFLIDQKDLILYSYFPYKYQRYFDWLIK